MQPVGKQYPLVVEGQRSTTKAPGAGTLYINPEAAKLRQYFAAVKAHRDAQSSLQTAPSSNSGGGVAASSNSFNPVNSAAKTAQLSSSSVTTISQGPPMTQAIVLQSSQSQPSRPLADRVLPPQNPSLRIVSKAEANLLSQIALDNLLYEIFQQGVQAFNASRLGEARTCFELGISLSSQFGHHLRPEFHFQLAMIFYRMHHWAGVFNHIEHGLLHAFLLDSQINFIALKGLALIGQNRFSQAGCGICTGMKLIEQAYFLSSNAPSSQQTTCSLLLQAQQRYAHHLHPSFLGTLN